MAEKFDSTQYRIEYDKEHYKRIALKTTAEGKEIIVEAARKQGKSINRFIGDLIAAAVPEFEPIGN